MARTSSRPRHREDDLDLAARARGGDRAAFDELYRRHRQRVYALCLNLSGDPEEARDLLQETFVKAWRGLPRFGGRSSFATWLHSIAVNVCRDAARRRRPVVLAAAGSSCVDADTVAQVRATLSRLRISYRVALVLRYALSLSYQEIADTLHWSLPRVKITLHRARCAFREAYVGEKES